LQGDLLDDYFRPYEFFRKKISIIIPTLNEAEFISVCLTALQLLRERGHEVIVVDAASNDATVSLCENRVDLVLSTARGRARQLNLGAQKASGDLLLFLHVDSLLPANAGEVLEGIMDSKPIWGRFDIRLSGSKLLFRVIEYFMNMRSRLTGIATGDQAMFVSRQLFELVGGFPQIELMEDISISSKLKKICQPICLKEKVQASSRRWEQNGILKTVLKMWSLRLRYAIGVSPERLARDYE
jgi:rSAM/selenodomain-associated transferase 2